MRPLSFAFTLGATFAVLVLLCAPLLLEAPVHERVQKILDDLSTSRERDTLLLTGDVMLSRQVERIMRAEGYEYPFSKIEEIFKAHTHVLVNFEGTIPLVHKETPSMGFSFSVRNDIGASLKERGVTHAGFANNHAFDFGEESLTNAKTILADAGILAFGHPNEFYTSDIAYVDLGELKVAIVPIHAVFKKPSAESARAFIEEASKASDFQIVYVHWGVEYEPIHDPMQAKMAAEWIDAGADAIVGHHPHVVQDIARIKGVLVFYSLGNLVFDQYWDTEVRTGLMLSLHEGEDGLAFTLIPVRSELKSVPEPLSGEAKEAFFVSLAERSAKELENEILEGNIGVKIPILAPEGQ